MAGGSIRNRKAHKRSVVLALVAVVVLLGLLSVRIYRTHRENMSLMSNESALNASVEAEKERGTILDEQIDRTLSEEEIIDLAHRRFGLVFPNEIVFVPEK